MFQRPQKITFDKPSAAQLVWDAIIVLKEIPDSKDIAVAEQVHKAMLLKLNPDAPVDESKAQAYLTSLTARFAEIKKEVAALPPDKLTDAIGALIWEAVMSRKKIPDEREAAALKEVFLTLGPKELIEPILKTCLESLVRLHQRIEKTAAALQKMLPVSADELKYDQLRAGAGDALHRKWQEDNRSRPHRFKPCLTEKDQEKGATHLKAAYAELKTLVPFEKFYKYEDGEWKENILIIDNSHLQPMNSHENNVATEIAAKLLTEFLPGKKSISSADITKLLLEKAGPETHDKWRDRNQDKNWVRDCQRKSFAELPALEAILDFQVLTALDIAVDMLAQGRALAKQPGQNRLMGGS